MTATKAKQHYSSSALFDLIEKKYPQPAWVVLAEVCNGTGLGANRWADAVAFGVWPSQGLQIIGFEFKSSRSDWRRELENPSKADDVARYCDEWWVVASDDVVKLEEVPKTWGWFAPTARGGLKAMTQPKEWEHEPISQEFLMSVIRNISRRYVARTQVDKLAEAKAKETLKWHRVDNEHELKELRHLRKRVDEFKDASGIDLENEWRFNPKEVGEVVRAVMDTSIHYKVQEIAGMAKELSKLGEKLKVLPFMREPRGTEDGA